MKSARRLRAETVPITIRFKTVDEKPVQHDLTVHFAYKEGGGEKAPILHEIGFVTRGIVGQGLDQMLVDLGVKLSRAIQGRNPETGEEIHDAP